MLLLHVGAFHLDVDGKKQSLWHGLAPQTRVLCALFFVFATALTPHGRWETWAIYGLGLAVLIALSRSTLTVLLKRVAVEAVFLTVVLLGTLFHAGGTVIWQWGFLQITTQGLTVLGSVSCRAILCLLMLNLLILTTPIPALLQALASLRVPPILVATLTAMYRYIEVLVNEIQTMRRAAASRNLNEKSQWQRLILGNMFGALFIRTYERGDRVYQAMLARGYTGMPLRTETCCIRRSDRLALTLMVGLLLLGQLASL